jgi:phospholipid/cholesterol/gamma-HCH transport system substrate-binding protein
VLEALDSDTQAYLQLLLVGAGKGLDGRDKDLAQLMGGLGPINRDLRKVSSEVATRQQNVRNLVHNFNILTGRVAEADEDLVQLVQTSNTTLGAIAEQDPSVRRAVALLGPTLSQAEDTLNHVAGFAKVLGPTFDDLRPFARHLEPANDTLAKLATAGTPALRDEIRPFVRAARKPLPDLRTAADRYSSAAPRLTVIGKKLNRLTNMAAYNPKGAEPAGTVNRDEGYLFWAAWLAHNGQFIFNTADGNGPFRRIYFTAGCQQILNIVAGGPGGLIPPDENLAKFFTQVRNSLTTGLGTLLAPGGLCSP